eukprot:TRINITY_DN315_c0_g1_i12.p1 TRINITY_DN315_c0_g1~~TRINITY_DN315_c0_g1_i12.p1  ORF type:complete len:341 (-),score=63.04 TRINITY_DN315_c0_g1_i12:434-1456(-)
MMRSLLLMCLSLLLSLRTAAAAFPKGYRSSRHSHPRLPPVPKTKSRKLNQDSALPKDFDWRNVNGQSLVLGTTADMNQELFHNYCGDCYIHATLHTLNDRIKIARKGAFPDVSLSRQALLNCLPPDEDGTVYGCEGGDPWVIHEYLYNHSIPDASCLPYENKAMECTAENTCRLCMAPAIPDNQSVENVTVECMAMPRENWVGYGVSDYGTLSGEEAMMEEIFSRGPITCSMVADDPFVYNYTRNAAAHEGVYALDWSHTNFTEEQVDHNVEVTGWGETDSGVKYWVMRNSWGSAWGDLGWGKMRRGVNELLIERECDWSVPDFEELDSKLGNLRGSRRM